MGKEGMTVLSRGKSTAQDYKIEHEGSSNCNKKKLLQQANLNIHY